MKKRIWPFILIAALVIAGGYYFVQKQKPEVKTVELDTVKQKDLVRVVSASGYFYPNKEQKITLQNPEISQVHKAAGDSVQVGDLLVTYDGTQLQNQVEQLKLSYEIAKLNLANAKDGRYPTTKAKNRAIDIAELQVDTAKLQLEASELQLAKNNEKAEIEGRIVQFPTLPLQRDALMSEIIIHDLSAYKVMLELSQQDAIHVKLGQEVSIEVRGLEGELKGNINQIQPFASSSLSAAEDTKVKVEVLVKAGTEAIKAGYQAECSIFTAQAEQALYVPFDALMQDSDGQAFIYTVKDDNTIQKTVLQTGLETDLEIEVLDGIALGASFVASPATDLQVGDLVQSDNSK